MTSAATRSVAGMNWAYTLRVVAGRARPRRLLTVLTGTPASRRWVAAK